MIADKPAWDDAWAPLTVTDFGAFVGAVHELMPSVITDDRLYWFRGQQDKSWQLDPSFSRMLRRAELGNDATVQLEDFARSEFQGKAHFFVNPSLMDKVKTIPCWWSLMQHHGAPTRLLDWSISPYVALYFAVNQLSDKDGAVWCFCKATLREEVKETYKLDPPPFEHRDAPKWYEDELRRMRDTDAILPLTFHFASSERMVAQQGRFTMSLAPSRDHGSLIERLKKPHWKQKNPYLRKIIIPGDCKRDFLLRLRDINITAASLFPGVDGLGKSIEELISLGPQYERAAKVQEEHPAPDNATTAP